MWVQRDEPAIEVLSAPKHTDSGTRMLLGLGLALYLRSSEGALDEGGRLSTSVAQSTTKPSRIAACESRTSLQTISSVVGCSPDAVRADASCTASAPRRG